MICKSGEPDHARLLLLTKDRDTIHGAQGELTTPIMAAREYDVGRILLPEAVWRPMQEWRSGSILAVKEGTSTGPCATEAHPTSPESGVGKGTIYQTLVEIRLSH